MSMLIVFAVVDRYERQYHMLLESQQALLAQRSAWGYSGLLNNLQTHKLQQSMLTANPPPKGCLSDEFIAGQQRSTATQSTDIDGLAQFTLRVPIHQMAPLPKPQAPRITLRDSAIHMTSRQQLGFTCDGRYAVIQETQTRMEPQPLLPPQAMGSALARGLIVHVALTQSQGPTLYFDIHFTSGKATYLPATDAAWSTGQPPQVRGEERFSRDFANLHHGLQMHIYSEPLAPDFLSQFLSLNGLGLILAFAVMACLLLISGLVAHLMDNGVEQHRAATRDFLTGLYNRRYAMTRAEMELARATRTPGPICVLMLDIDHFKQVNDTHGHDGGDQVLKFFAQLLTRAVRQQDLVARIGGEEFLVLLPDTDLQGAQQMANRLLQTLRNSTVEYAGKQFAITCSLGICAWQGPGESVQNLLIRADRLLYQAKQQGRNRYVSEILPDSVEA
jgi:diguanylate cyclase (GGDEF)-like protein